MRSGALISATDRPRPIAPKQVEAFDRLGYLHLENWLPPSLVEAMREAAEAAMARAIAEPEPTEQLFLETKAGRFIGRINSLHRYAAPASLALAGSPELRTIGETLCGADFLSTYESLVAKRPGDEQRLAWHQDMIHARRGRIVTVGVYLSPTSASEGALRVLAGTHLARQSIAALPGLDAPEAVIVEARPGDVVIHDAMLVHGSDVTAKQAQRLICYLEYRPLALIEANPRFTPAWIAARRDLAEVERAVAGGSTPSNCHAAIQAAYAGKSPNEPANYF